MQRILAIGLAATVLAVDTPSRGAGGARIYGALQTRPERAAQDCAAGMRLATLEVGWSAFEPREGAFNADYIAQVKARLRAFRAAGLGVVLELGFQYPPGWIFEQPHSRFVNQYGAVFDAKPGSGANGVNAVFSRAMREKMAAYLRSVFQELGTDFFALRLGGGYFGELCYPSHRHGAEVNCYWAFDPIAQGRESGLPEGMKPCPRPGWLPGTASKDHADAAAFADWYLDCLKNYHDWQIATARGSFPGTLAMLYPSWGARGDQIRKAVAGDLGGGTSVEKNGEIQRGFDFARLIGGIRDPGVIVYCTWLDADNPHIDDGAKAPDSWHPAHYLASLAAAHDPPLRVWGENAGRNDLAAMERCFRTVRRWGLMGMIWAFESDLYDPAGRYATIGDYARLIAEDAKCAEPTAHLRE